MHADKIVVLEGGKVVQVGTHSELIASEGTYARLLRRQMLEEDLGARGRNTAARVEEKAGVGD
jgi:ABC-type transport system involved in cytochrome bd biosynthesis fused ATPase/permease subunit